MFLLKFCLALKSPNMSRVLKGVSVMINDVNVLLRKQFLQIVLIYSWQFQCTCRNNKTILTKHDIFVLKSFLMVAENKFCFTFFFFTLKKSFSRFIVFFGVLIFWQEGKNCVVKNEKWIEVPDSRYVSSNPGRQRGICSFLLFHALLVSQKVSLLPR